MSTDLIFVNGQIITMDDAQPRAEALLVRDGRIVALGKRAEIESLCTPETGLINLEGGTLLPGFIEAHGHPLSDSLFGASYAVDVRPFFCPTYEDVMAKIRQTATQAKAGEMLFFRGLDLVMHRVPHDPTAPDLDAWAPHNPIVIIANPGHAAWANTAALEILGITDETPDPPAGHFERDDQGHLTGKATESGSYQFTAPLIAGGSVAHKQHHLLDLYRLYAQKGVTLVSEQGLTPEALPTYRAAAQHENPSVRVRAYMRGLHGSVPVTLNEGSDAFRVIGIKLTADGSPWVGNIAVSDPYLNTDITLNAMGLPRDNRGPLNWSEDQLMSLITQYGRQGWQVSVHAHGDRAIAQVLRCYAAVIPTLDGREHRFRMEHCGNITDAQIAQATQLGVLVSFFPSHVYWWGEHLRNDLFNLKVAERWMPMGSAEQHGMRFSLHNDGVVTPMNPLLNIRTAATRLTRGDNVLGADQRVSVLSALKAHTIDAAFQLFLDHETGSLTTGKRADLVWLSANPIETVPEHLHEIDVLGTWLGGRRTYDG